MDKLELEESYLDNIELDDVLDNSYFTIEVCLMDDDNY